MSLSSEDETIDTKVQENKYNCHIDQNNLSTVLHVACAKGNSEVVRFCIEEGFDLYEKVRLTEIMDISIFKDCFITDKYVTGFECACFDGHINVIKILQKYQFDISKIDPLLVIVCATWSKSVSFVKYLLDTGCREYLCQNDFSTLLCLVCGKAHNDLEMAKLCLREGADVNYQNTRRATSFHYACSPPNANLDLVKLLISKGCDMNILDEDGYNGFSAACAEENLHLIKYFHTILDPETFKTNAQNGFYFACQYGSLNIVKFLVETGVNMNDTDAHGWAGIHYACNEGELPVVRYLMKNGCDMHIVTFISGYTPLQRACLHNHVLVIQCLVDYISFEGIDFWNFDMTTGLQILLDNFTSDMTEYDITNSILLLLEAGTQLQQNGSLPPEIKNAVKYRMVEITFMKSKLMKKFCPRIAQLIIDFTMLPSRDTSLQNLPQHLY